MNDKAIIDVIIPAFNEADSIAKVIGDIPKEIVREIIVCNNNSTDNTSDVASNAGAKVLLATKKGYGSACLKGLDYLAQQSSPPDIVVFIDGDYSDYPEQLPLLIEPIQSEQADLVIGSRALGKLEKGSMTPQQVFFYVFLRMFSFLF